MIIHRAIFGGGRLHAWTADVESERLGKKRSEDLSDYSVEAFDE